MPIFSSLGIAALLAGTAGSVAGDVMSYEGTQSTNAANEQENQENIYAAQERQQDSQGFNAGQAAIARQFSAQQAQQQEDYQTQSTNAAEAYDTQMSDTAMQRRVADLKAAGLNPLLAVSEGGASAPTMTPTSGAMASAPAASSSAASQGSSIPMQNPSQVFGNLGGQINSAIQASATGAQIDLLKAQTNKVNEEAGVTIPSNANYLKSLTGLTDQNATQAYYNTQQIQEQIYGQRLSNDQLRDVTTPMAQQNLQVLQATRDALISAQNSDATAKALGLQKLRNLNDIESSQLGQILNWFNAIIGPIQSATGVAHTLAQP